MRGHALRYCRRLFVLAALLTGTAATAEASFATYPLPVQTDETVSRIDISTYRLRAHGAIASHFRKMPPPVDDVYDRYKHSFTAKQSIARILTVLRKESADWWVYRFTVPAYRSVLRISGGKAPSTTIYFEPGSCRSGKNLIAAVGNGKVLEKHIAQGTCEALMLALDMPERFWKQP